MGELLLFLAALAQSPADSAFFEQKIRPVLVKHCYSCHAAGGAQAKAGPKGGLLLDSREGLLKGGDSGPALAPGKPEESLIYQAIRHDGLQMPPTERLPEAVAADFEKWIRSGAFDPRTAKSAAGPEGKPEKKIDLAEGRKHWAFQPPALSAPPPVRDANWPRSKTDAYILAKLEAKGLRPAPPADRAALLRRLHFDLVGLPPAPAELDAFLADKSPTALENTIDRLLASRQFAERWARHWLDVARYADS
ncbi:MAG TPA: DUF1549 domain-containing protein, partial [Planctomycetia bacterium]|nr:DUF1549 domain-containing protein [Planctomycetia bacterium]